MAEQLIIKVNLKTQQPFHLILKLKKKKIQIINITFASALGAEGGGAYWGEKNKNIALYLQLITNSDWFSNLIRYNQWLTSLWWPSWSWTRASEHAQANKRYHNYSEAKMLHRPINTHR